MTTFDGSTPADGIAVIGMAGRFPGAQNIGEFWRNLCDGVESVTFFSDEELLASGERPEEISSPDYVRAAAICDDIDLFDADFFGIAAREAELTNPQFRLFLTAAWEALEHAGYDPKSGAGRVGLFAGSGMNGYLWNNVFQNAELMELPISYQAVMRNGSDFLTTYVSYLLGLRGPSLAVQTACSTSLVAVHLACMSLLNGECDLALAAGVRIHVPHKIGYRYQEGGIHSSDGHCRPFDARAEGIISGNGVGVVVLKPLESALADGDRVYAVIRGSAINNDGAVKAGYTAPSVNGQVEVIRAAQAMAEVDPETISYIEAHGTGTPLGDPIEVSALTQAFRAGTDKTGFCAIGSVKSNIGHLDAAAGVTGLIKTVLSLSQERIPPSLHIEHTNPAIDFANSPFYVNTKLTPWPRGAQPRRAGVSSFGIGGTNAHVVLEEAPRPEESGPARPWQLLVLSAKTGSALDKLTDRLARYLREEPAADLADVAYTLQVGRHAFEHRRVLLARDADDARMALETRAAERVLTEVQQPGTRPVVYLFSGQGAQYPGMGRELYDQEPVFRTQVDRCAELLAPHLGLDIREVLYPDELRMEDGRSRMEDRESAILHPPSSILDLNQTWLAQPALFVVEYALAKLWASWGVRPAALIGHSIGEYVAACIAGVFSLEDALALVAARGQLIQRLEGGAMLAVPLAEQELRPLLGGALSLAAINGPARCVVSGPAEAVAELEQALADRGVTCRRLHTSHAFHSKMMEPALEPFLERVRGVTRKPPRIPLVSNVTGTWMTPDEAQDPHYWVRHLREPVHFGAGLETLFQQPERILLEVGPGRTLRTLAQQHPARPAAQVVLASLRHPEDTISDQQTTLTALGKLWLAGAVVDWAKFTSHERRRRVPLPTYPFEGKRFWSEPTPKVVTAPPQPAAIVPQLDITIAGSSEPAPEPIPTSTMEQIVAQQLALFAHESDLMAQQLELLARGDLGSSQ